MSHVNLDLKYRPLRFEDVRGQERCVSYLSNLVLRSGAKPRNLLFFGSVGSGKTTLARIYARAINCETPTDAGSPCGTCANCRLPDTEHRREFNVPAEAADVEKLADRVADWVEAWSREPKQLRYRTLFFDEAHHLKSKASDVLLKAVEEPADGIVFVFATTEIEEMRPALLSRLAQLEIQPFSVEQSMRFLREIAEKEEVHCEDEALALLASVKNGYARDLIIGLEQCIPADGGVVTRARVKSVFDLDHIDALVEYLNQIACGDHAGQTATFLLWREPAQSKLRWIQSAILAIYYHHVLSMNIAIDPLVEAIDAVGMSRILKGLRERFGVRTNREMRSFLRQMVEFWSTRKAPTGETQILLYLACFHDLIASLVSVPGRVSAMTPLPANSGGAAADAVRKSAPAVDFGKPKFIGREDVEQIVRAASLLPQEYGKLFNLRFDLFPGLFGVDDEAAGYEFVAEFLMNFEAADHISEHERLTAYIAQFERGESGLEARVLAYSSSADQNSEGALSIARWHNWRRSDRLVEHALTVRRVSSVRTRAVSEHWREALDLCAGLGSNEFLPGLDQTLTELVGIRQYRDARPVRGPVVLTSEQLSQSAWATAEAEKMGLLSAYDDRAWQFLKKGWELDEWKARKDERLRRKARMREINERFGLGSPEALSRLEELMEGWSTDPRDRLRSWNGWWDQGAI